MMERKAIDSYSKDELYRMVKILIKDIKAYRIATIMFGMLWVIANLMFITAVLKVL